MASITDLSDFLKIAGCCYADKNYEAVRKKQHGKDASEDYNLLRCMQMQIDLLRCYTPDSAATLPEWVIKYTALDDFPKTSRIYFNLVQIGFGTDPSLSLMVAHLVTDINNHTSTTGFVAYVDADDNTMLHIIPPNNSYGGGGLTLTHPGLSYTIVFTPGSAPIVNCVTTAQIEAIMDNLSSICCDCKPSDDNVWLSGGRKYPAALR